MERTTTKKAIKKAIEDSGIKQFQIAEKLGITQATVSNSINRPRIGIDVFISMMDAMGYAVVVGKIEKDSFVPIWELEREQ